MDVRPAPPPLSPRKAVNSSGELPKCRPCKAFRQAASGPPRPSLPTALTSGPDKRTPDVCYSAMPLPRKRRPIGRILTSAIDALDTFSRVGQCQELKLAWASNATSMRRQNATVSSAKAATTITPGPDPAPVAV